MATGVTAAHFSMGNFIAFSGIVQIAVSLNPIPPSGCLNEHLHYPSPTHPPQKTVKKAARSKIRENPCKTRNSPGYFASLFQEKTLSSSG